MDVRDLRSKISVIQLPWKLTSHHCSSPFLQLLSDSYSLSGPPIPVFTHYSCLPFPTSSIWPLDLCCTSCFSTSAEQPKGPLLHFLLLPKQNCISLLVLTPSLSTSSTPLALLLHLNVFTINIAFIFHKICHHLSLYTPTPWHHTPHQLIKQSYANITLCKFTIWQVPYLTQDANLLLQFCYNLLDSRWRFQVTSDWLVSHSPRPFHHPLLMSC